MGYLGGNPLFRRAPQCPNNTVRSLRSHAATISAIAWAIRPKMKQNIFITARHVADGWIAATFARCSTMKGHYRIRPTIGADKIWSRAKNPAGQ